MRCGSSGTTGTRPDCTRGTTCAMCATARCARRLAEIAGPMRARRMQMMVGAGAVLAMMGCHSVPPPKPLEQLNVQETRGHQVYQAHCAVCHYDRVSEPLHGPPLRG